MRKGEVTPEPKSVKIRLADGDFAIVDEADYPLVAKIRWRKSCTPRSRVVYVRAWSARVKGRREEIAMHRLITGAAPNQVVRFKDGNGLNNRRSNLLVGSRSDASHAQVPHSDKRGSRYKGVYFDKATGMFRAQIQIDGKRKQLGRFATEKEAAQVWDKAATEHFGDFATPNFPPRKPTRR